MATITSGKALSHAIGLSNLHVAKLTKDIDEIVKASGTKYSVCPVFKPLKQLKKDVI